jgi:hypothetical protein
MTIGAFSFSMAFLLASISFTTADLTAGEEEGPTTEEECMLFFFTSTDEVGMTFFPEVVPCVFLNLDGHIETSSTSTFTATGVEGAATEEGANHLVPGSLRQWSLSGLVISKGGGDGEEVGGVECGGDE